MLKNGQNQDGIVIIRTNDDILLEFSEKIEEFLNSIINEAILKIFLKIKSEYGDEFKSDILALIKKGKFRIRIKKHKLDDNSKILSKDSLGVTGININTGEITLFIDPFKIFEICNGDFNTSRNILLSVLCHELAHILSTETPDREIIKAVRSFGEKCSRTIKKPYIIPNIRYHRSGISFHYGEFIELKRINEGITDFYGEIIFNYLKENGILGDIKGNYISFYVMEKETIEEIIGDLQNKLGITYEEAYSYFEKAYLLGGFYLTRLLSIIGY